MFAQEGGPEAFSSPTLLLVEQGLPFLPVLWAPVTPDIVSVDYAWFVLNEAHDPGLPVRTENQASEMNHHLASGCHAPYTFSFSHKVCLLG